MINNDKFIKEVEIIKDEIEKKSLLLESECGLFAAGKRKKLEAELVKLYAMLAEKQAQLIDEQEGLLNSLGSIEK